MNRLMRILVMFDLPVKTKAQRRSAAQFRKFLVEDGYHMVQYSVYARVCNGRDSVEAHRRRIQLALPPTGSVLNTPSGMVPSGRSNGAHRTGKWCRLTAWMVHGHTASV